MGMLDHHTAITHKIPPSTLKEFTNQQLQKLLKGSNFLHLGPASISTTLSISSTASFSKKNSSSSMVLFKVSSDFFSRISYNCFCHDIDGLLLLLLFRLVYNYLLYIKKLLLFCFRIYFEFFDLFTFCCFD